MTNQFLPKNNIYASDNVRFWVVTFFILVSALQIWRIFSLNATYDQGIFLQEIWNTLQGRPFESTLASELSAPVKFQNALPEVGYRHLAQHFTPLLILWAPLVGLLGVWSLPIIQVGLIASAGWTLFLLGKKHLPNQLAGWIACSFFTTGTVIGPSLENFHDLCIVPLLVFLLLLGISSKQILLYFIPALMLPLVREDVGLLTFGIGLWMIIRRPQWRLWGIGLCIYAVIAVILITNYIMPIFGSEISDRFMQERFSQYLDGDTGGTLDVLVAMIRKPLLVLTELISPPGRTIRLLITLLLPLAFVPSFSIDAWLLIALPLFVALSSNGGNALSVHLRFMLYLVPGVFAGSIFWWERKKSFFENQKLRNFWKLCICIALTFAIIGNPHRSLSAIIPDSISPWVHVPITKQFDRGLKAKRLISEIPPDASVAAETHLIPQLAKRRILLRFPENYQYKDRQGKIQNSEFIISQPSFNASYSSAFNHHASWVIKSGKTLKRLTDEGKYGVFKCNKNSIILRRNWKDTYKSRKCLNEEVEINSKHVLKVNKRFSKRLIKSR